MTEIRVVHTVPGCSGLVGTPGSASGGAGRQTRHAAHIMFGKEAGPLGCACAPRRNAGLVRRADMFVPPPTRSLALAALVRRCQTLWEKTMWDEGQGGGR